MNSSKNLIHRLQVILSFIASNTNPDDVLTEDYIYRFCEGGISEREVNSILNQLEDDGYIASHGSIESGVQGIVKSYQITYKGNLYLLNGGYKQTFNDKNELRELNRSNKRLQFIIAFGTSIAALYYLLEILNHLFKFYPN